MPPRWPLLAKGRYCPRLAGQQRNVSVQVRPTGHPAIRTLAQGRPADDLLVLCGLAMRSDGGLALTPAGSAIAAGISSARHRSPVSPAAARFARLRSSARPPRVTGTVPARSCRSAAARRAFSPRSRMSLACPCAPRPRRLPPGQPAAGVPSPAYRPSRTPPRPRPGQPACPHARPRKTAGPPAGEGQPTGHETTPVRTGPRRPGAPARQPPPGTQGSAARPSVTGQAAIPPGTTGRHVNPLGVRPFRQVHKSRT